VDSGYYAACAGLRAKSQALEVVANNVANLNSTGYASVQVDKKKIGQLAVAIQTAFQQMGVFPGTGTGVPISSGANEPLTDNQKPEGQPNCLSGQTASRSARRRRPLGTNPEAEKVSRS